MRLPLSFLASAEINEKAEAASLVLASLLETLSWAASGSWTCEQALRGSWGYHPFCSGQEATVKPLRDGRLPWAHFLLISCFPDTMKLLLILQIFPAQIGAGLFSATSAILPLKPFFCSSQGLTSSLPAHDSSWQSAVKILGTEALGITTLCGVDFLVYLLTPFLLHHLK